MSKRILSIFMAVVLMLTTFAACKNNNVQQPIEEVPPANNEVAENTDTYTLSVHLDKYTLEGTIDENWSFYTKDTDVLEYSKSILYYKNSNTQFPLMTIQEVPKPAYAEAIDYIKEAYSGYEFSLSGTVNGNLMIEFYSTADGQNLKNHCTIKETADSYILFNYMAPEAIFARYSGNVDKIINSFEISNN